MIVVDVGAMLELLMRTPAGAQVAEVFADDSRPARCPPRAVSPAAVGVPREPAEQCVNHYAFIGGIRQDGCVVLESFLSYARELLAIPSTADRPEDLNRALDFVLDIVGPGFMVERFESRGKPSALVYLGPRRPRFRVIFNAHLDVVPARPEQFQARLEGTRLYGRGTQDMKVSALVQAMAFRELAGVVAYPLALQLVTDEEVGGRNGTLHQLEQGVSGEFVIIGEHSRLCVVTESRGLLTACLRAEGRSGHSAYQWLGDNAIIKLMRSLDKCWLVILWPPKRSGEPRST